MNVDDMPFRYFVSFFFASPRDGWGNTVVGLEYSISSEDDIRKIERALVSPGLRENVVVMNFQRIG